MALRRCLKVVDGDGDNAGDRALKLAFATTDMKHVNQHFGSARTFAIHAVSAKHAGLLEAAQFEAAEQDGNEDKLVAKIAMLEGCAAVYCKAVGSSAVRQLLARGILPVKVVAGAVIADLIETVQDTLRTGAPVIARRRRADAGRFEAMEREGWEE